MLTEKQLEQLEPLIHHPKFGNLLKNAIEIWKCEDVTPAYKASGIELNYNSKKWELSEKRCQYLLGAALVGKNHCGNWGYDIQIYYNLTDDEIRALWISFDNLNTHDWPKDAINFAQEVRKIVNPIPYNSK